MGSSKKQFQFVDSPVERRKQVFLFFVVARSFTHWCAKIQSSHSFFLYSFTTNASSMHLPAQKHIPFSNPSHNDVCQTASRSASYRRTPRNACLQPQESRERCHQIFVSACFGAAKIFRDNWGISHKKKVVFTICTEHPHTRNTKIFPSPSAHFLDRILFVHLG